MRKVMHMILSFLVLLAIASYSSAQPTYTIDGNTVYIDDTNVYISQTPHTLFSSGWVTNNLTSKGYSGDIDIVFGFDTSTVVPSKAMRYNPQSSAIQKSYTCESPNWFNYTTSPNEFWCWNDTSHYDNITQQNVDVTLLVFSHNFDTANLTSKTAYWTEYETTDYQDIASAFTKVNYDHDGKDTWYYASGLNVQAGVDYSMKIYVDIPFGSSGKYDMCVKPSSLSVQQAVSQGKLYCLDPWWNTTWLKKKQINITNSDTVSLDADYTANVQFNLSACVDAGNCQVDADDVRMIDNHTGTEIEIDRYIDGSKSMRFLGTTGDSITMGDVIEPASISIQVWAKTTQTGTDFVGLVDKYTGNAAGYVLDLPSGTNMYPRIAVYTSSNQEVTSTKTINDGSWHQIVGIYNTTHCLIYIDGVINATGACTGTIAYDSHELTLAGDGVSTNEYNGALDEVIIWNKSLTSAEVSSLYNSGLPEPYDCASDADVVGCWHMEDVNRTNVPDSSGEGNDGTLNGNVILEEDSPLTARADGTVNVTFRLNNTILASTSDLNYSIYYGNPTAANPPDNKSKVFLFYQDYTTPTDFDGNYRPYGELGAEADIVNADGGYITISSTGYTSSTTKYEMQWFMLDSPTTRVNLRSYDMRTNTLYSGTTIYGDLYIVGFNDDATPDYNTGPMWQFSEVDDNSGGCSNEDLNDGITQYRYYTLFYPEDGAHTCYYEKAGSPADSHATTVVMNTTGHGAMIAKLGSWSVDTEAFDSDTGTFGSDTTTEWDRWTLTTRYGNVNQDTRIYESRAWKESLLYTATLGSEEQISTDSAPTVTLSYPGDATWNTSQTISFGFTPTDDSGFTNCSIWTNESGSWISEQLNTSSITNNSVNTISHNVGVEGTVMWNVQCFDNATTPQSAFAAANYTVKVDSTFPQLTISSPTNMTYGQSWVWFNWSYTEVNQDTFQYSLDGASNVTINISWTINSSLVNGLGDVGANSNPSIADFDGDGNFELIAGNGEGLFDAYRWNGTEWISNASLFNGLTDFGTWSSPSMADFDGDGNIELIISGGSVTPLDGFRWNGTEWISNSSLILGLVSKIARTFSMADFDGDGNFELIMGEQDGIFYGYRWNGTEWISNSSLILGLVDAGTYSNPSMADFDGDGNFELIAGNGAGLFDGYRWNGTEWISNSFLILGLVDAGTNSKPSIADFDGDGNFELIAGNGAGLFDGYRWNSLNINISSISDGSHNITLYANDSASNENSTTQYFSIDTTAPTTSSNFTSTDWQLLSQAINLTCTDAISGCNTTLYCTDQADTCTPTIVYSVPFTISSGGTNYVRFFSNDSVNNTEVTNSQVVKIDFSAPTTTDNFTDDAWKASNQVISLSCNDGSESGCNVTLYCTDQSNSCNPTIAYSTPVTISAGGESYIRYYSNDTVGNIESNNSQRVRIDKSGPSFSSESLNATAFNGSSTAVELNFSVSDAYNTVDSCWAGVTLDDATSSNVSGALASGSCTVTSTISQVGDYSFTPYANDSLGNENSGATQSGVRVTTTLASWEQDTTSNSEVNGTAYIARNITINNWLGSNAASNVPISLGNRSGWVCTEKLTVASASTGSNDTTQYAINCTNSNIIYHLNYTYALLISSDNETDVDLGENVTFNFHANNSDTIPYSSVIYNTTKFYESGWSNISTAVGTITLSALSSASAEVNVSGAVLATEITPPSCPPSYTLNPTYCALEQLFTSFINYGYRHYINVGSSIVGGSNVSYDIPVSRLTSIASRESFAFDVDDSTLGTAITIGAANATYIVNTTHNGSISLSEGNHYFDMTYIISRGQGQGGGATQTEFSYEFDIDPSELNMKGKKCARVFEEISLKNLDLEDHRVSIFFEPYINDVDQSWEWMSYKIGNVEGTNATFTLAKDVLLFQGVFMNVVADIPCDAEEGSYRSVYLLVDEQNQHHIVNIFLEVENRSSFSYYLNHYPLWEFNRSICMDTLYKPTIQAVSGGVFSNGSQTLLGANQTIGCIKEFKAVTPKLAMIFMAFLAAVGLTVDAAYWKRRNWNGLKDFVRRGR